MKKEASDQRCSFRHPDMTRHIIYNTDALIVEVEDLITIEEEDGGYVANPGGDIHSPLFSSARNSKTETIVIDDEDDIVESSGERPCTEITPTFINLDEEFEDEGENCSPVNYELSNSATVNYEYNNSEVHYAKNVNYILEPETMIVELEDPITLEGDQCLPEPLSDEYIPRNSCFVFQYVDKVSEASSKIGPYSQLSCFTCGRSFDCQIKLHSHMKTHVKPQTCPLCHERFEQTATLKKHLRKRHVHERPHHCDFCLGSFSMKTSLQVHMRSMHFHEKPYECHQCGKRFAAKQKLRWHAVNHTGEKPHKCPVCQIAFSRKDHMGRHFRAKHPGMATFTT